MLTESLLLVALLQDPVSATDLDRLLQDSAEASPAQVLLLAEDFDIPEDDGWQDALEQRLADATPKQQLLLGRILALGDSTGGSRTLSALLENEDLVDAALATLVLPTFLHDEDAQEALGNWLIGRDPEDAPQRYVEVAVTLHEIGDAARRRAAQRLLDSALGSLEPATRAHAAIGLARTGRLDDDDVLDELEQLASGVGTRSVLAQSLIEQYEQRLVYRAKIQTLGDLLEARDEEDTVSGPGDLRILEEVLAQIQRRHMEGDRFTREELIAAAADGMLRRLDPYSNYMTGDEFKEFVFDMNPEYGGIGAYVNTVNGYFTITRPIYSGPAYEVGLHSGDRILEVDGWSTIEQPDDEIIKRLKGKPGTTVTVKAYRRGWTEPKELTIERRVIHLPTLQLERLPGEILYLELVNFTDECGYEIAQAIEDAEEVSPLNGVVLDLRDNPGGYLSEAVQVCDVFLPPGKLIVRTESRVEESERYYTREPALIDEELPVVVLVNGYSASASEIVSGALSIHGRAKAIGERTHGKGSVQNLIPLRSIKDERWRDDNRNGRWDDWEEFRDLNDNGSFDLAPRIKLTLAYYYLPDGTTIHTQRDREGRVTQVGGVEPDIEVRFPELDIAALRELDRLLGDDAFQTYADDLYENHQTDAVALAEFDGRDLSRYPGWEAYFAGLETILEPNEVRRWVRRALRNRVSDARGKNFAGSGFIGDFQEDPPLATGIEQILQQAGLAVSSVPEYAQVF